MGGKQINIIIAEPSAVIAAGLAAVLANYNSFKVLEQVTDLKFLPDAVSRYSPDIVIVNPALFDYKSKFPLKMVFPDGESPLLVAFTSVFYDEAFLSQFDAVMSVYDSPASIAKHLRSIVENVRAGGKRKPGDNYDLSEREKEILVAVAKGKTNKEIADEFNISVYTVISHRKNITQKTGIKSIAGLTVYAMLNNMLDSSEL